MPIADIYFTFTNMNTRPRAVSSCTLYTLLVYIIYVYINTGSIYFCREKLKFIFSQITFLYFLSYLFFSFHMISDVLISIFYIP